MKKRNWTAILLTVCMLLGMLPGTAFAEWEETPTVETLQEVREDENGEEVQEELETCEHEWGEWSVTTEPGCEDAGERTRTCGKCEAAETEAVEALGHQWGEWSVTTEPGCEDAGEKTRVCDKCGAAQTEAVEALGHEWDEGKAVEGGTQYACDLCGETHFLAEEDPSFAVNALEEIAPQSEDGKMAHAEDLETLETALADDSVTTIIINTGLRTDKQINIARDVTLEGINSDTCGLTYVGDTTATSEISALHVYGATVTIKNLKIAHNTGAALVVNGGATVTVDGLVTSANFSNEESNPHFWGGVNVDKGSTLTTTGAGLTCNETVKVWSEADSGSTISIPDFVTVYGVEDGMVHYTTEEGLSGLLEAKGGASVVAKVGEDKYFTTLQGAIDACPDNGTVTLVNGINYEITSESKSFAVIEDKTITLDLNGNTLKMSGEAYPAEVMGVLRVNAGGKLTLADSAETKGVIEDQDTNYNRISAILIKGGEAVINEGVTVKGRVYVREGGELTVNGIVDTRGQMKPMNGSVEEYAPAAIMGNGGTGMGNTTVEVGPAGEIYSDNVAIYHPQSGTLNIAGKVEGAAAVGIKSGVLNITDSAVVKGLLDSANLSDEDSNNNGIKNDGSAIVIDSNTSYDGNMIINIQDGAQVVSDHSYAIREIKAPGATSSNVVKLTVKDNAVVTGAAGCISLKDASVGAISGGRFSHDVSEYCVPNVVWDETSGEVVPIGGTNAEARIGETYYKTLQEAINAATEGQTVTLVAETVTESVTVEAGKDIILDLNGRTLKGSAGDTITNKGTLVIRDSAFAAADGDESKMGKIVGMNINNSPRIAVVNEAGATCTIESGMITRQPYLDDSAQDNTSTNSNYTVQNKGKIDIKGGLIVNNSTKSSLLINYNFGPDTSGKCGTLNGVEMTISGGTISQPAFIALKNDPNTALTIAGGNIEVGSSNSNQMLLYGTVKLVSGTVSAGSGYVTVLSYKAPGSGTEFKGTLEVTGGELICKGLRIGHYDSTSPDVNPEIKISGADTKITTTENIQRIVYGNGANTESAISVAISGGTFSTDVSEFCVAGTIAERQADGSYKVKEITAENAAARIGDVYYETLGEAVRAAGETPTTIVLVKNVTLGEAGEPLNVLILENQDITLDLNGHTISSASHTIENNGTLTVTGQGEITTTGSNSYALQVVGNARTTLAGSTINGNILLHESSAVFTVESGMIKGTVSGAVTYTSEAMIVRTEGTTYYKTLGDAIGAAAAGETVKVVRDFAISGTRAIEKDARIDLNGKTISGSLIVDGCEVTIVDSSDGAAGRINATSGPAIKADNNAIVTVKNGTVNGAQRGIYSVNGATVNVEGGTVSGTQNGIFSNGDGLAVNVTGGTVSGKIAIQMAGGVLDVSKDAMIEGTVCGIYLIGKGSLTMTDGTVKGTGADGVAISCEAGGTATISGGIFSHDVKDYCAKGYATEKQEDGTYLVKKALGGVTALNGGATVDGNAVTYGSGTTLLFTAEGNEAGRLANHWWAGIRVTAPEGASGEAKYQTKTPWASGFGEAKLWSDNTDDGAFWAPADQAYINNYGTGTPKALVYTYQFDWDCDGTYEQVVTMTVQDGIKLDETGTVAKADYGLYYGKLQEAIDAAPDRDGEKTTITLVGDTTENVRVAEGKNIVLNLGGKTLTGADDEYAIYNLGTLTVNGEGNVVSDRTDAVCNFGNGNLTINGGTFTGADHAVLVGMSLGSARVTINGGVFESASGNLAVDEAITNSGTLVVYGGTFSSNVKAEHCAPGHMSVKSGDRYVVQEGTPVAEWRKFQYPTLQAAIDEVPTGSTVKLLKSTSESVTVGKTITLEIPGNVTLTNQAGEDTITVALGGSLTVTGSGTVDNTSDKRAAVVNNGTANLSGGTFSRSRETGSDADTSGDNSFYTILNHGAMTIGTGVTVRAGESNRGGYSSLIENGYQSFDSGNARTGYVAGTNGEKPRLTINGGSFNGGLNTVKNDDNGVLTIHGGAFTNFTQAVVQNHNETAITGGTFTGSGATYGVDNCGCGAEHDTGKLTITGGTFTGAIYGVYDRSSQAAQIEITNGSFDGETAAVAKSDTSNAVFAITGGIYSNDVRGYCAEDYIPFKTEDGKYEVKRADGASAGVNGAKYGTLQEAVNAAGDKDTVELLQNVADGTGVTVDKSITIDFKGFVYTVASDPVGSAGTGTLGFQLLAGADKAAPNTVVMKNGTIVLPNTNANLKMGIQNYANLTLDNMKLDAGGNGNIDYVLNNNNGSTTITGGTVLAAAEGKVAFDVRDHSGDGYGDVSVSVDNATVTGVIQVSESEKARLAVSGGTFTQELKPEWCAADRLPVVNGDGTYGVTDAALTITPNRTSLSGGGTVTLTVTPANLTGTVTVTRGDTGARLTRNADGTYTATLSNTTANYTFTAALGDRTAACTVSVTQYTSGGGGSFGGGGSSSGGGTSQPTQPTEPEEEINEPDVPLAQPLPFLDVTEKDWFYEAVRFTYDRDMFKGTDKAGTVFAPGVTTTRGMIVTILHRLEGAPQAEKANFTDVGEGAWYADAVNWAAANGVVKGFGDGSFRPEDVITREQMVAILSRYAALKGYDKSAQGDLEQFQDRDQISGWAREDMTWAVGAGILKGRGKGILDPRGTTNRAEAAEMLKNFCEKFETGDEK